jgi:polyisoprenoid-binding protein YceI
VSSLRSASGNRPSWLRLFLIVAAVAVLAAAAAGAWYLFFRPAAPAEVALAAVPTAAPTEEATDTPASEEPIADESAAPATSAAVAAGLDGTWTVDPSIGSFDDFSGSFVGYRVTEELVGIGTATAVGRTPDVTGSLTLDGSTIAEASFEADLTTLQSDSGMRDGQLGRQGLETDTYPTATFVLAQPIELDAVPAEGDAAAATAVGDLTLHGVTQRVEIPLEAQLSNGVVTVVGSLPVNFGDYGMTAPESMRVLSIDENGTMEFQLQFAQAQDA